MRSDGSSKFRHSMPEPRRGCRSSASRPGHATTSRSTSEWTSGTWRAPSTRSPMGQSFTCASRPDIRAPRPPLASDLQGHRRALHRSSAKSSPSRRRKYPPPRTERTNHWADTTPSSRPGRRFRRLRARHHRRRSGSEHHITGVRHAGVHSRIGTATSDQPVCTCHFPCGRGGRAAVIQSRRPGRSPATPPNDCYSQSTAGVT